MRCKRSVREAMEVVSSLSAGVGVMIGGKGLYVLMIGLEVACVEVGAMAAGS